MDAAAKRGTIYAVRCVSDPNYPMILHQSGHQSGTLDTNVTELTADSFKNVGDNIKPYEDERKGNEFQVFSLSRGTIKEFDDSYLSPIVPTVEDKE